LINGPWKGDHPASPHRILNAYVKIFTGFEPEGEVDDAILAGEPELSSDILATIQGFPMDKILRSMIFFVNLEAQLTFLT
jgi:hypothetical protein